MAYFEEHSDAMVALEKMVDDVGLRNVVYALASIANGKADHLASNWHDRDGAREWQKEAKRLDILATKIEVIAPAEAKILLDNRN